MSSISSEQVFGIYFAEQPSGQARSADQPTDSGASTKKKKYAASDPTVQSWLEKYAWAALVGRNEAGNPMITCSICIEAHAANNFASKTGAVCKDASEY